MSGGGGVILNGGIAAAVSTVLVALIQTFGLRRAKPESAPPEPPTSGDKSVRRHLLEFADLVDEEASRCSDTRVAARLQLAARQVRVKLLD